MVQYSRKLAGGIKWWYKFGFKGKTYISECIYLSKNEAKKAEAQKISALDHKLRNPSEKPNLSLLQIINERLDEIKIKKSKKYYKENKRYLSLLINQLKDVSVYKIEFPAIEKLLLETSERLQDEGKDNYAVNAMIRCYKALFNYANEKYKRLELKNPFNNVDFYSIEKKLKYIPTDDEIEAVLKLCDDEQKRLIEFIESTAARINECLNLKGCHVFENEVVLYTRKSRNSNNVPRKVPKPDCLKGITFKPDELVFGRWKVHPCFLDKKVKRIGCNQWSFHNLRHRRASMWSKEKKPLFEIMCLLGHSNLSTTQKYLQLL